MGHHNNLKGGVSLEGVVNVLDSSGDTTLEWSAEQDNKLDPDYVKGEFDRLIAEGHLAFNTDTVTHESEQIKTFDPKVHHWVTVAPLFVGG